MISTTLPKIIKHIPRDKMIEIPRDMITKRAPNLKYEETMHGGNNKCKLLGGHES